MVTSSSQVSDEYVLQPDTQTGTEYSQNDPQALKQALGNERAAPELLHFQRDLVTRLQAAVQQREHELQELWQQGPDFELVTAMYTAELARVRYLLRAYLRIRLMKLERFVMYILDTEEEQEKVSDEELEYAKAFFQLYGGLLRSAVTKHLAPEFRSIAKQSEHLDEKDMIQRPDLDKHVFCRVLEDYGDLALDDAGSQNVRFVQGDLYIVRYRTIRALLHEGGVKLI